jgi:hypothetical protein
LWLEQKDIGSLYAALRSYDIVDLETLQLLEPSDPEFIRLPLVARKKLLKALKVLQSQENGPKLSEADHDKYKYDIFLSHKRITYIYMIQFI